MGSLSTVLILNNYCRKNELKAFEKASMGLVGSIVAIVFFAIATFPINFFKL